MKAPLLEGVIFHFNVNGRLVDVIWENQGAGIVSGKTYPRVYVVKCLGMVWRTSCQCNISNSMDYLKDALV